MVKKTSVPVIAPSAAIYLVLAPGAKDAPAAMDKLLLWQLKTKQ
jgi:hypothetical protein